MSQSRIPSPARSLGAPVTPRRYKSRTRSVGSPARSTTSGRLSALVQFKENNKDSFVLSPAPSRRSVLNDNTDIEEPRRRSWWKNLADNSRDVMEVLNDNKILETNEAVEEYIDIEVLSQEKKNYSIDIPESSDSESISSIYIPQRKLFTQKDQGQNKFGQLIGTRETLAKLHKSHAADKSVHVAPKNLFGQGTKSRAKPVFPAALLNLSPNKTANKTKENAATEVKGQVRNLFGNRAGTKRKNMFADFIVSESEDEISEIQPRVFGFPKKTDMRRDSANSRGKREHSPTSSVTTDIEMDDWKMLPSSTMVENQLEDMMAAKTPVKRARLSKLAENKISETKTTADLVEKEPSDEEQELKYEDDDDKSEQNEQNQDQDELDEVGNEGNNDNNVQQSNVQMQINRSKQIKEKEMSIENDKFNQEAIQNENRVNLQNFSKGNVQNLNQSKTLNVSQQRNNVSQKKVNESQQKVSQEKQVIYEEAMDVESEQEQNNRNKSQIEKNKSYKELQVSRKENTDKINEKNKDIEHSDNQLAETEQLENVDNNKETIKDIIQEKLDNNVDEVESHEEVVKNVEENDRSKVILEQKLNKSIVSDKQEINNSRKSNDANYDKSQNISKMAATEADEVEEDEDLEHQKEEDEAQENEDQNESEIEEQKCEVEDPEDSDKEDQNESDEEIENESEVNEQDNESEHDVAMDDQEENEVEQNESEMEVQNESEVQDQEESENEAQNESEADQQNESVAEAQNENAVENESEQEIAEDEVNDSEQEELEDNDVLNDSETENENDEAQNESEVEMQEESAEVLDEMDKDEQNESYEDQDEIEDEAQNESAEVQEDIEDEEQNESSEIQDDVEDEAQNESADVQEETEDDAQNESREALEESEDEIQNSNDQQESDNDQERNETHDTTGRHRKKNETKVNSPEAILHDKTNQLESFTAQGRNTSVRKTTMLKNLNIRPSLAPPRESTELSDGTRNSSAEGSGWDSHRTTRKTLRQTFGRDFTPRKSLRALVMEKSANRQTAVNEMTSVTAKFPQANSTELPEASMAPDDSEIAAESNHDVSKRTRQTTLEMYLQKIKKQNMERKLKMEEAVKNSLKAPTRDVLNPFKVPSKPIFSTRKPNKMASKPKAKPVKSTLIPLDDLPAEVIEDMKYKPPKRFQPSNASWITKRLYKFLESKLESKYDYKARVRAEKLVETIYHFCKDLRRVDVAPPPAVDALKHEMARLDVVKTHFDFYQFFHEYMPREVRVKVVPDVVNKINVPRHGVFSDIIRGNTVQG